MTLDELITSHGFNPKSFARDAGIERESLRQYRRGLSIPSLDNASKIAKTLGVSIETVHDCCKKKEN